jgi:hypothetical protein
LRPGNDKHHRTLCPSAFVIRRLRHTLTPYAL